MSASAPRSLPVEDRPSWLTYHGTYDAKRYSSLDQIDRGNVQKLHPLWMYQVRGRHHFETTPLVFDGMMYLSDPPSGLTHQLTEVTLYRVGALGTFVSKQVELRPGTYTAIGSRDGYRDVRRTFTVVPGRELPTVSVVCIEQI